MVRALYDVSRLLALTVASWGLDQLGGGLRVLRQRLPESKQQGAGRRGHQAEGPVQSEAAASEGKEPPASSPPAPCEAGVDPLDL
jgi:hypothetical protein